VVVAKVSLKQSLKSVIIIYCSETKQYSAQLNYVLTSNLTVYNCISQTIFWPVGQPKQQC